ncbi:hypothetical protein BAUCODRAFT_33488 [Baudoinia panamericana UAMH 10762]|uniref:G-protein coupled receptors family 3 profile domain-containing protein n=1 Tax=Baudoinia panamericana (strain UAMH 10762) TaxID=717646 RepID=M2MX68_BAUPA|nr:uncharacterized protein BAUCODRAFT_33488 [Baudoinia panamericana UAMH 10762]EMC96143.1 hypothetical protein BAUCODRAFT_33488 [Baudoinia panamericana UAMH 10762]
MSQATRGPPYAPTTAGLGGQPTLSLDVPLCAVFLLLYLCFGTVNATIFVRNLRRGHKFLFSWFLVAFCLLRIITCALRIAWATEPRNIQVIITANIFVNVGIIFVYVINLFFAYRILCARQPEIGWSRILHYGLVALLVVMMIAIFLLISMVVFSSYTLSSYYLRVARDCQLFGLTYFTFIVAMAPVILATSYILPKSSTPQHFGKGEMHLKSIILAVSCVLCALIAGFKAGVTWSHPRPRADPAWFHSKACFYCFGFMLEIIILTLFLVAEIDQRFHIPNGSTKRRSYHSHQVEEAEVFESRPDTAREASVESAMSEKESV